MAWLFLKICEHMKTRLSSPVSNLCVAYMLASCEAHLDAWQSSWACVSPHHRLRLSEKSAPSNYPDPWFSYSSVTNILTILFSEIQSNNEGKLDEWRFSQKRERLGVGWVNECEKGRFIIRWPIWAPQAGSHIIIYPDQLGESFSRTTVTIYRAHRGWVKLGVSSYAVVRRC